MPLQEIVVVILRFSVSDGEGTGGLAKATPLNAIIRAIAIMTAPIHLIVFFVFFLSPPKFLVYGLTLDS
jgi:hypothetical protein